MKTTENKTETKKIEVFSGMDSIGVMEVVDNPWVRDITQVIAFIKKYLETEKGVSFNHLTYLGPIGDRKIALIGPVGKVPKEFIYKYKDASS